MSVIDKIKARVFSAATSVYVEEWDETIWVRPLSCGEMTELQRRHKGFPMELTGDAMVDLVIRKVMDKSGEKMFTLEDKPFLLKETTAVISNVVAKILSSQISVEDAEKN